MGTKICPNCGEEKDESAFPWQIVGIKRHSWCSECRKEYQKGYYQRTKDIQAEQKVNRIEEKREERNFLLDFLNAFYFLMPDNLIKSWTIE